MMKQWFSAAKSPRKNIYVFVFLPSHHLPCGQINGWNRVEHPHSQEQGTFILQRIRNSAFRARGIELVSGSLLGQIRCQAQSTYPLCRKKTSVRSQSGFR